MIESEFGGAIEENEEMFGHGILKDLSLVGDYSVLLFDLERC